MPGTVDVSRLVLQVDASIELAKRQLRELGTVVDQETTHWDDRLKKFEQGTQRTGRALANIGQFRGGMQQLSFQIGDIAQQMSLGTKASVIFAQQSGQVIQAIQLMNTGTSGFLRFLAGPWGAVLTTATVILATFAGKLFESRDEVGKLVDKMREEARQAELSRQAEEAFNRTLEGQIKIRRELNKEIEQGFKTDRIEKQEKLGKAQSDLAGYQRDLRTAQDELRRAKEQLQRAKDATPTGENPGAEYIAGVSYAQGQVDKAQARVDQLRSGIAVTSQSVRDLKIAIATLDSAADSDPIKKINDTYDDMAAKAKLAAKGNDQLTASLKKTLDAIEAKRKTALDAAREAKKESGGTGELSSFIMPVSGPVTSGFGARTAPTKGASSYHPAIDIAAPIGTPVKAAAPGVVIYTGKLGGLGNVVVVDHGGGTITEYGHLSKILTQKGASVDQGAVIAQVGSTGISTGPHLDYRVKVAGKYVDPRKGKFPVDTVAAGIRAGNAAIKAEDLATDQDDNFKAQLARLEEQALSAQMELVQGIEAQAKFAADQVDLEQKRYEQSLENEVNDNRLRDEQRDLLVEKSRAVSQQRKTNIETRRQLEAIEAKTRLDNQDKDFQIERLRHSDQLARTSEEHRRIQLEIIDLLYQQKEADLRIARAKAESAKNAEQVALIDAQLAELPAQRARDRESATRGTMNPLEQWADSVPRTAAEINEAMMGIQANGLDALADGLAGVIGGTQSLGDAFKSIAQQVIADIARMIARMLIMRALMSVFGSAFGGGGIPAPDLSSGLGPVNVTGGLPTTMAPISVNLPGLAGGGIIPIGGLPGIDTNILSINGVPRARVSSAEGLAVIPDMPRARVPRAANDEAGPGGGHTFNIRVVAANTGDPIRDRQSALQQASAVRREVSRAVQANR